MRAITLDTVSAGTRLATYWVSCGDEWYGFRADNLDSWRTNLAYAWWCFKLWFRWSVLQPVVNRPI